MLLAIIDNSNSNNTMPSLCCHMLGFLLNIISKLSYVSNSRFVVSSWKDLQISRELDFLEGRSEAISNQIGHDSLIVALLEQHQA
jgi:hypothetical protein